MIEPSAFDAVTVKLKGPCTLGVPVIAPVDGFSARPAGNVPAEIEYVSVETPEAVTPSLNDSPRVRDAMVLSVQVGGSMLTFNEGDADDVTPFDVCVALTAQVPSTRVPRSHDPLVPVAVKEHVTGVEPAFVAVTVTDAPLNNPFTAMLGVLSPVRLSVLEEPVSEDAERSTAAGAGIPTDAVAAEIDVVVPEALTAVDPKRRNEPASAAVATYVPDVAPLIGVQSDGTLVVDVPDPLHRYH